MFKQKGIMKQKGFTLLELLVVITLLAILAVGGLVAYDGVTDNAEASAAAYNAGTLDRAVRQYRAVTNAYPDQWDNLANPALANAAAGSPTVSASQSTNNDQFLALQTREVFGSLNIGGTSAAFQSAFYEMVDDVWGMEEIQHVFTVGANVAPGKMHNEGSNVSISPTTGAIETNFAAAAGFSQISILPTADSGVACTIDGQPASQTFSGAGASLDMSNRQNAMNDALGSGRCHFVVALGFGGDAASSTSRASVQIPAAPTYTSPDVNPAEHYGRYIGLFHVARTNGTATNVTEADIFARPKLIGFVDTAGNPVDVNIAASRDPS